MTTGRQTIPATTTTALEVSGFFQMYITPVSNNIDVVNSGDSDATEGYTLTADTEYLLTVKDSIYFYAGSETVIKYLIQ